MLSETETSVDEVLYLCIILRKCQLLGAKPPDPHRGAAPGPCGVVLQTRYCPPLIKILLAPMSPCARLKVVMLALLCMASNIKIFPLWTELRQFLHCVYEQQ